MNQLESEAIIDAFTQAGFSELGVGKEELGVEEKLSVVVINTCTVTSKADQKARRVIRKALADYPDAKVIVTGCYAQLNKDEILKLDENESGRLSVIEKDKIINIIPTLLPHTPHSSLLTPNSSLLTNTSSSLNLFQFNPKKFSQHTRSFLKIQDGCDNHCTYCRIRLARGKSVSLEKEEVLSRLRVLEENHAEAVLTGVNISQYYERGYHTEAQRHGDEESNIFGLGELLDYLLKGTEKIAIRLSSLDPQCINKDFAGVLAHKRIRPHFHLSVQSGCKSVLEKMGRSYDAKIIAKAVSLLRHAKKDPFLACDIIAGFPGETQNEFEETYNLCEQMNFAWIHAFPYSKRPGTPAFSFSYAVHEADITDRVQRLTELAWQGRADYVQRWLGREVDVLVEKGKKHGAYCSGVSENYLKTVVQCEGKPPQPGTVLRCMLLEEGNFEEYDVLAAVTR